MAKAASSDRVSSDMRPTDYRGAVKRMDAIAAKRAKQKAMASAIGAIYVKLDGVCGADKRAPQLVHDIPLVEPEDQLTAFLARRGVPEAESAMGRTWSAERVCQ